MSKFEKFILFTNKHVDEVAHFYALLTHIVLQQPTWPLAFYKVDNFITAL